jgi:hypothetical protein
MDLRLRFVALALAAGLILGGGLAAMQRSQGRGAAPEMAITGRVLDPSGKPVAGTFVTAPGRPNVRVAPLTMVRATGRLVVEAADRASLDPASVGVGALPTPIDGNPGPSRHGTVGQDLRFEFRAWPMPARIRVMIESPGWVVKAVRHNGADITDQAIEFVEGKEITGLEVVVTRGTGRR